MKPTIGRKKRAARKVRSTARLTREKRSINASGQRERSRNGSTRNGRGRNTTTNSTRDKSPQIATLDYDQQTDLGQERIRKIFPDTGKCRSICWATRSGWFLGTAEINKDRTATSTVGPKTVFTPSQVHSQEKTQGIKTTRDEKAECVSIDARTTRCDTKHVQFLVKTCCGWTRRLPGTTHLGNSRHLQPTKRGRHEIQKQKIQMKSSCLV